MKQLLLKVAHKIIEYFGNEKKVELQKGEIILENVFKTNFNKKVLISYLKNPFLEGIKYHHTNYLECYTAAEIFKELGYNVDVIDLFDDTTTIEYGKYNVVYGLGIPFEKSFYSNNSKKLIKILYSTGCNPFFSYVASLKQINEFYKKSKILIAESSRVSEHFWACSYLLSDYIIALGNEFVLKTYLNVAPYLKGSFVNAFYFNTYNINLVKKNFEKAKKHFLWFGSSGLLHKGLNHILDIFINRNDIVLHICGASKNENQFWNYYDNKIKNCNNIINHDFVNIESKEFFDIMDTCAFCIFPTASEGGSPALLNVMANGGLIPIASKECGIDLEELGYLIDEINYNSIDKIIIEVQNLSEVELYKKAKTIIRIVKEKYEYNIYKSNLFMTIDNAIKQA